MDIWGVSQHTHIHSRLPSQLRHWDYQAHRVVLLLIANKITHAVLEDCQYLVPRLRLPLRQQFDVLPSHRRRQDKDLPGMDLLQTLSALTHVKSTLISAILL